MKQFLKKGIITLVIIGSIIGVIKIAGDQILNKQQMAKKISEFMKDVDYSKTFSYAMPKRIREVENISFGYEQEIKLKVCSDNLLGKIQIRIENEEGEEVFALEEKNIALEEIIHLDKGEFKAYIQTGMWGYANIGIQKLTPDEQYLDAEPMKDSDSDGLNDEIEIQEGTDSKKIDTDGDGISDYYEVCKYKTNPLKKDSDADGVADSEWNERREYTYTIQAIVDLRPPFDEKHMNDFYQDARKIEVLGDDVTRFEFIIYPQAEALINPKEYVVIQNKYTEPTYTKNYTQEMIMDMKNVVKEAKTDFQVIKKIIQYFYKNTEYVKIDEELGYGSDMPLLFNIYKDEQGNIKEEDLASTTTYSIQEIKERNVFADSMYRHKMHGACGSTAVLKGAMLRAAGIEEKTIFTIPLIFTYDTDETTIQVKEPYDRGEKNISSQDSGSISNHYFHEVKIGNQWVRADDMVQLSHKQTLSSDMSGEGPIYIKILECQDQTDYNFHKYWNEKTWNEKRAYKYRSVIEKEPQYNVFQ